MEYIDIIDKNGELINRIENRDYVHQKGLLHRHIHVWIINSNAEVLLQRRAPNKKTYPNMWSCSSEGHVSAGKTLQETVIDEVWEELNVKISVEEIKSVYSYSKCKIKFADRWIENAINYIYLVYKDIPIEDIKIQLSEVSEVQWMNLTDYRKKIENHDSEYRLYPEEFSTLWELI